MTKPTILMIKLGFPQTLTFADGSVYESAIRKQPVPQAVIHALGAQDNDVGLKEHHGGVDKALFFMSDIAFPALNKLLGTDFSYTGTAIYGENFVVSGLHEDNVCVGDQYRIGDVIVEVSQPRKPCERLSKNTGNARTQRTVFTSGWTGWYVRVLQPGTIRKGDEITLLKRPYPEMVVRRLNRLLSEPPAENNRAELEQALACNALAAAFKRSLNSQLSKIK